MATTSYKRTLLTGGTSEALDSIDGAGLLAGNFAFGLVGGTLYIYLYKDYGSAQSESSPELIVPDTNPGNFAWQLQEQRALDTITTDTTLYIATTGDDVTGDGTSGDPWYSLNAAFDYLKDKWINTDVTVTIDIAAGTYTGLSALDISHPCGKQIVIDGAGKTTTVLTFTAYGLNMVGGFLSTLSNLTIKGASTGSNNGFTLCTSVINLIENVKFDTWFRCLDLDYLSTAAVSGSSFFNYSIGVNLDQRSHIYLFTSDFDGNTGSVPFALKCDHSSTAQLAAGTSISANDDTGCFADHNSFIDAGSVVNSASTPFNPTETTTTTGTPVFGNSGSWILDA